ncbi:MAG: helix-turn-helix family protein [Rhodocyclales bacterium]|nr:helix-turn-helix family protein [Rhodocyclales bacterium]
MNYPINTLDQLRPILVGFRKSRQLTQAALADKLGVAQQTYAQLEANPSSASMERIFKLLQLLGVQLVLGDSAPAQDSVHVATAAKDKSQHIPFVAEAPAPYAVDGRAGGGNKPTKSTSAPKRVPGATAKKERW